MNIILHHQCCFPAASQPHECIITLPLILSKYDSTVVVIELELLMTLKHVTDGIWQKGSGNRVVGLFLLSFCRAAMTKSSVIRRLPWNRLTKYIITLKWRVNIWQRQIKCFQLIEVFVWTWGKTSCLYHRCPTCHRGARCRITYMITWLSLCPGWSVALRCVSARTKYIHVSTGSCGSNSASRKCPCEREALFPSKDTNDTTSHVSSRYVIGQRISTRSLSVPQ